MLRNCQVAIQKLRLVSVLNRSFFDFFSVFSLEYLGIKKNYSKALNNVRVMSAVRTQPIRVQNAFPAR